MYHPEGHLASVPSALGSAESRAVRVLPGNTTGYGKGWPFYGGRAKVHCKAASSCAAKVADIFTMELWAQVRDGIGAS